MTIYVKRSRVRLLNATPGPTMGNPHPVTRFQIEADEGDELKILMVDGDEARGLAESLRERLSGGYDFDKVPTTKAEAASQSAVNRVVEAVAPHVGADATPEQILGEALRRIA